MTNRENLYKLLRIKLEEVGFEFEVEQKCFFQKRGNEMKFVHPLLVQKLTEDGFSFRAKKFYIKPLTDKEQSEIGLVTGKSSPLNGKFCKPNACDSYDSSPAWINRNDDKSLDILIGQISKYLGYTN
jgi:hypothetical protein